MPLIRYHGKIIIYKNVTILEDRLLLRTFTKPLWNVLLVYTETMETIMKTMQKGSSNIWLVANQWTFSQLFPCKKKWIQFLANKVHCSLKSHSVLQLENERNTWVWSSSPVQKSNSADESRMTHKQAIKYQSALHVLPFSTTVALWLNFKPEMTFCALHSTCCFMKTRHNKRIFFITNPSVFSYIVYIAITNVS